MLLKREAAESKVSFRISIPERIPPVYSRMPTEAASRNSGMRRRNLRCPERNVFAVSGVWVVSFVLSVSVVMITPPLWERFLGLAETEAAFETMGSGIVELKLLFYDNCNVSITGKLSFVNNFLNDIWELKVIDCVLKKGYNRKNSSDAKAEVR